MLKGLSTYTFAGFLGAGINFLIMPLLSYYLTPFEYGILSIFNTYVIILIPLIGLVASSLVNVEYYQIKEKEKYAALFSSVQAIPVIPFLLFFLVFATFHESISNFIELSDIGIVWIILIPVIALLTVYIETFFNFLIVKNEPTHYAIANISKIIIEILFTLLFVVYYRMGWEGRLLSWLITSLLYMAITWIYFWKQGLLTARIKWYYVKAGILYGAPLILHTIGKFVINQSDRLFIAKYISLEETGIYNIGYQIGMILLIVVNAFGNFFTPFLFERLGEINQEKKIEILRVSYLAIAFMLVLLIMISAVAPVLFAYFIDPRYEKGQQYVFWIGLSYLFWGVYTLFAGYLFYLKKTKVLGYLAVVNVLLNIVLNFALIEYCGAIGVAYATCLSFFVVMVCVGYFANKYFPMPWFEYRTILGLKKQ